MKARPKFALLAAAAALFSVPAFADEIVVIEPVQSAPVVVYEEPITIQAWRGNEDALITNDVVYAIANDPRLSGNIGVDTYRGDVTLSGRVSTPGQRDIAGRNARSVDGVRDVQNLIRPRVGENF